MKIKDLPAPKTKVRLTFKENVKHPEVIGTIFSAYKMPPGHYRPADIWRVPFLIDGDPEDKMKLYSMRSIAKCEVIE
jgi:hypothetical protein